MSRKLTAIAVLAAMMLVVSSAFGQTTTHKKKKKKKHGKPAATTTTIELDDKPPTPGPAAPANGSAAAAPGADAGAGAGAGANADANANANAGADANANANANADANAKDDDEDDDPLALPWSAGLLLGYGFDGAEHFGFGLRGGYTLPMHLYLGATLVYHVGSSDGPISTSLFYPGVEGGYEITAGPVVLRPYVGFGPVFVRASLPTTQVDGVTEGGGSSVTTLFGVWGGGLAVVPFADRFFAGGDLRLVVVSGFTTVGFFVTGGARF